MLLHHPSIFYKIFFFRSSMWYWFLCIFGVWIQFFDAKKLDNSYYFYLYTSASTSPAMSTMSGQESWRHQALSTLLIKHMYCRHSFDLIAIVWVKKQHPKVPLAVFHFPSDEALHRQIQIQDHPTIVKLFTRRIQRKEHRRNRRSLQLLARRPRPPVRSQFREEIRWWCH